MNIIKTSTPAFPAENERQTGENDYRYAGLTKREYFVAAALTGVCASNTTAEYSYTDCAKFAVKCADSALSIL